MSDRYFIGLISGTSRDGVDAALVLFEKDRPRLLHALCLPYQEPLRSEIEDAVTAGGPPAVSVERHLDEFIGRHFARAASRLVEEAGIEWRDVEAIGSHGQTIWHDPDGTPPCSIQLGCPEVLRRVTGCTIISRFRAADLAAGGQGAPLAPLLHQRLFAEDGETRAVLNLGGIANLTLLDDDLRGWDTGPGNCLLDLWALTHLGERFDRGGAWAGGGQVIPDLLRDFLDDPYFRKPAPKSTGLEYFNRDWLRPHVERHAAEARDVQATLAELTARTVAVGVATADRPVDRLLVCGGGVHNLDLMTRLKKQLSDTIVASTERYGAHPDWIEATLFAWLARERLASRPQDTRSITGADKPVLLGELHERTDKETAEVFPR